MQKIKVILEVLKASKNFLKLIKVDKLGVYNLLTIKLWIIN